jgi:hypothetical protein
MLTAKIKKAYNTDQTGINLEMHTGRTLNLQGEKTVEGLIQRANAMTHSYTVQPVISSDGHLQSPMLMCLFEPAGEPKKFASELEEFTNLCVVSTKSGLLTAALEKRWMKEVFLPKADNCSLLLVDSWSGYKQSIEDQEVKDKLYIKVIPPKTTGQLQPLDVFFNRQFKSFIRQLSDHIRKHHCDFVLSTRVNIAKLISLIHYQFMAPRFNDFIRYAWHASGYKNERPNNFQTPPQYCLEEFPPNSKCKCSKLCMIRCAYCTEYVCFTHCIQQRHRCCTQIC